LLSSVILWFWDICKKKSYKCDNSNRFLSVTLYDDFAEQETLSYHRLLSCPLRPLGSAFLTFSRSKYSLGLSFTAPLCSSSKCLFVICCWKSAFSIWKTDYEWEFIIYKSVGCTKVNCLKVEDGPYIPWVSIYVSTHFHDYTFKLSCSCPVAVVWSTFNWK
jgi:hypothetical protein